MTQPALILGADPGIQGAIAVMTVDLHDHRDFYLMDIIDLDNFRDKDTKDWHDTLLSSAIGIAVSSSWEGRPLVVLEGVHSMPGDGHVGAFTFGNAFGTLRAALRLAGCRVEFADPGTWKAAIGLTSDKTESAALARRLFPYDKARFMLKKHVDRAEAALLAWYGRRFLPTLPRRPIKEGDLR